VDRRTGEWSSIPVGPPVDEFRFGDGETDTQPGSFSLQRRVVSA